MLSQTSGATVECTGRHVKDRIKKTRRRVADEVDDPPRLECTCLNHLTGQSTVQGIESL
jgi:hypothetical protein